MLSSSAIWNRQAMMSRSKTEGLPLRLRRGAAAEEDKALWACVAPGRELVEQPALADAGIGHHGDGGQIAIDEQPLEGVLKRFEFGVPADHPRRHAFDAARDDPKRARLRTGDQVALGWLVDTLDHERRLGLDVEEATHVGVGFLADAQAAAGAVCSMRAATLTAIPRMAPSRSTPPPRSTSPV